LLQEFDHAAEALHQLRSLLPQTLILLTESLNFPAELVGDGKALAPISNAAACASWLPPTLMPRC
jgi:hypothetical protein